MRTNYLNLPNYSRAPRWPCVIGTLAACLYCGFGAETSIVSKQNEISMSEVNDILRKSGVTDKSTNAAVSLNSGIENYNLKINKKPKEAMDSGVSAERIRTIEEIEAERGTTSVSIAPGGAVDLEGIRAVMQGNPRSAEYQRALDKLRAEGRKVLQRVYYTDSTLQPSLFNPAEYPEIVLDKMPLRPLSEIKPPPVVSEHGLRMAELQAAIGRETDAPTRDRVLLILAGYHVGQGDWASAKAIYENLSKYGSDELVKLAVGRNLRVVDKNLEILKAANQKEAEPLRLELAVIHQELGHEKAAKKILQELSLTAQATVVKTEAEHQLKLIDAAAAGQNGGLQ